MSRPAATFRSRRYLRGLETLEERRLLSVNSHMHGAHDVHQDGGFWHVHDDGQLHWHEHGHHHERGHAHEHRHDDHGDDHWRHGIPFDDSDWTLSTVAQRFGTLDQADVFSLQSKPDSNFTLYLDFDGHVTSGTIWNSSYGIDPIVSPAFDLDGDSTSFSQMELERILVSWQRTAEDFAPFDVNVTTRDPGLDALINSGGSDATWGARAVATFDTFANCGCGGHAFLNTFDDPVDTPTFVYNLGEGSLGETFSHEVGHMLGLVHDGDSTQTYYPGHGSGATQWGAIMGAPFDENVTHWDIGEYFDSNNGEDDLGVIAPFNGFDYRPDDFGNSTGSATPLDVSGGTALSVYGIIERNTDMDFFSFETAAGNVSIDVNPLGTRPNLDIFAALYDSGGNLVAFSNPSGQLEASINANVAAGTYFLRVEGVGSDDVFNTITDTVNDPSPKPWESSTPTGYSDYGSLGQYTVDATVVAPGGDTFSIAETDAVKPEGTSGQQPFVFTVTRTNTVGSASVQFDVVDSLPDNVGDTTPSPTDAADFAPPNNLGDTTPSHRGNTDVAGGNCPCGGIGCASCARSSFNGTVTFADGEASQTITLNVVGDTDFELDEYFDVVLSNPSAGFGLADSRATGIIQSDESEIGVSGIGAAVNVNEGPYDGALVRWRQIGAANGNFDEWAIDNVALQNSTLIDDFDPIDNTNWSTIVNGTVSSQFPGGSGNALTMTGGQDRRIVTRLVNASPGDMLSFDIIFGDGSNGGENADPGEDVLMEFSLDGGSTWTTFDVFDTEDYTTWTSVQTTLPTGIDTNPPSTLEFVIERDGGRSQAATVDWSIDVAGLADAADGTDFPGGSLPSGQAAFSAGESTTVISIPVNPDFDLEADEQLRLTLTGAGGNGTIMLDPTALTALGVINNDDAGYSINPGPQFRLRQLDSSGGSFDNWGIDNVGFTGGLLSDDFDPDIDISQWNVVSLGQVNSDFGGTGNSLFFTGEGERSISTIPVTAQMGDVLTFDFIYGDDNNGGENPEPGEEVVLEYSTNGGQSWINMQTYDLNITTWTTMNENVPAASVRPPEIADEGVTFEFDILRFGIDTDTLPSTISWEIVGSGANPASANDFPGGIFPSGTLNFAAGETEQMLSIQVLDDGFLEADETFDLIVGNATATGTILNNDTTPSGDFDGDGDFDCDDVDALVMNIAAQTNVSTYDMDGSGSLDVADLDQWLVVAGAANLPSGNAYLKGDANLDGVVDGNDFLAWNGSKFTSGAGWCGGDFNADGTTDGSDFIIWNNNKFTSSAVIIDTAGSHLGAANRMSTVTLQESAVSLGDEPLDHRVKTSLSGGQRTVPRSPSSMRVDRVIRDWGINLDAADDEEHLLSGLFQ